MRTILKVIDSISDWMGNIVCWLALVLVVLVSFEVTMRYCFNSPTMWNYETSMMIGGTLFILGWAYTQRHNAHVRVDVFYAHLSPKKKAIIDVLCTLLLLVPFMILLINISIEYAWRAWEINEKSVLSYWYPPMAPFRTVVLVGFCLFTLQSIANFIRDLYILIRNRPL